MNRGKAVKLLVLIFLSIAVLLLAMGIGSVPIAPLDTVGILMDQLFGFHIRPLAEETAITILMKIRMPRTLIAFFAGGGLAVSGVVMQSILKNPLASSYTLGVSSGAALGASFVILFNISIFGFLTLQIFGLSAGLATVFLALFIAGKVDKGMQNNSIILMGMAFSLFANAMITILMVMSSEQFQRLVFWQMGSFSMKNWQQTIILIIIVVLCFILIQRFQREMDILTFGDEQAQTCGVEVKKVKWFLLSLGAILTGSIVAMVGIIGFVDLFTPHVARKIFGASHKYVLPASMFLGGIFMVICDLAARTIAVPVELPVGAITCAIGAPFFIYLYGNPSRKSLSFKRD